MAKYYGKVGYVIEQEDPNQPGVWKEIPNERFMRGDILRGTNVFQGPDKMNRDITFQSRISLIGDAYAYDFYPFIRYVEYNGYKWEVTTIEVTKPRIIVTLGGIYNG